MTFNGVVYIIHIHMNEPNFSSITGFDWDSGNLDKNMEKYGVSYGECEEVFFNEPFFTYSDDRHSSGEKRYYVLGETNAQRRLFIVFTIRRSLIRVISARDMSTRERKTYENLKEKTEFQE